MHQHSQFDAAKGHSEDTINDKAYELATNGMNRTADAAVITGRGRGVVHRHAPDPAASLLPLGAKGRREVVCKPIFFYIFHLQYKECPIIPHV